MSEANHQIDQLPPVDYSIDPRRVIHYVGETAGIVNINPNDPVDMNMIKRIEREAIDTNPIFARGKNTDQRLINWVSRAGVHGSWVDGKWVYDNPKEYPGMPIGVVGLDQVGDEAKGELLGWVQFYPADPKPERYDRFRQEGKLGQSDHPIIEISYGKLPDAPPGHMASGLRQACAELGKSLAESDESTEPNVQIIAYVAKENIPSINVLEATGFERKDEGFTSSSGLEEYYYLLNWEKLNEKMHAKSDSTLQGPTQDR